MFVTNHLPVFIVKISIENKLGSHKQYRSKAYTKKGGWEWCYTTSDKDLGKYYDSFIKDVNKKELVELKHEVEELNKANE